MLLYLIVRQDNSVATWLTSMAPQQWGDKDHAVRFSSRGEARRAATALKITGDWSIEPISPLLRADVPAE